MSDSRLRAGDSLSAFVQEELVMMNTPTDIHKYIFFI